MNTASNMSVAGLLSKTHVKNYCNFSHVVIQLFSVVEIVITPATLYNNK